MKNLRILIITDDEKSSSLAAKVVAENISALKLSANFYYAKSFDEVLNNRDKFLILNYLAFLKAWKSSYTTLPIG